MSRITFKGNLIESVAGIAPAVATDSIVSCTVKKKDGRCQVSMIAIDGRVQIAGNLFAEDADIEDTLAFSLGKDFVDVIGAMKGAERIRLEVNTNNVVVSSGSAKVTLAQRTEGVAPIAFDIMDRNNIKAVYVLDSASIKAATEAVLVAAEDADDSRCPGIRFVADGDRMMLRSMCSTTLAQASVSISQKQVVNASEFSVKGRLIKGILSCCKDEVKIYHTSSHVVIQNGMQLWQIPVIDSNFPGAAFGNIMADSRKVSVEFDKQEFLGACMVVSAAQKEKVVSLQTDGGSLMVKNADGTGNATVKLAGLTGELEETGINLLIVKNVLLGIRGEKVVMEFGEKLRPFAIKEKGNDDTVILVSPCKACK